MAISDNTTSRQEEVQNFFAHVLRPLARLPGRTDKPRHRLDERLISDKTVGQEGKNPDLQDQIPRKRKQGGRDSHLMTR